MPCLCANAILGSLYAKMDNEKLVEGTNLMLQQAKGLLAAQNTGQGSSLQITDRMPQDQEEDSA